MKKLFIALALTSLTSGCSSMAPKAINLIAFGADAKCFDKSAYPEAKINPNLTESEMELCTQQVSLAVHRYTSWLMGNPY